MISVFQSSKRQFITKACSASFQMCRTQEIPEELPANNDCRKKHSLSLDMNGEARSLNCCWQPFCDNKGSQLKTS